MLLLLYHVEQLVLIGGRVFEEQEAHEVLASDNRKLGLLLGILQKALMRSGIK